MLAGQFQLALLISCSGFHKAKIKVSANWTLLRRLWEESTSKFIQIIGRIQVLIVIGPRFYFLLPVSWLMLLAPRVVSPVPSCGTLYPRVSNGTQKPSQACNLQFTFCHIFLAKFQYYYLFHTHKSVQIKMHKSM